MKRKRKSFENKPNPNNTGTAKEEESHEENKKTPIGSPLSSLKSKTPCFPVTLKREGKENYTKLTKRQKINR